MLRLWLISLWQSARFLNGLAAGMAACAVLVAGACGAIRAQQTQLFAIQAVEVSGLRGERDLAHQNEAFLQQAIVPQLKGSYFSVDLKAVQSAFAQAPWVRHVDVRRVWPNRVWVVLEEHQPIALLNDDLLVNDQGEAFAVQEGERALALPSFLGEAKDAALMMTRQRELDAWMAALNLKTVGLALSDRRAWTARLSNEMILELGRDELQPATAQRVAQWVRHWPSTYGAPGSAARVRRVDLRYPNGFAVQTAL